MSVNRVILVGRLGRDPELKVAGGGTSVVNFGLATDESRKDKNGEKQKQTTWHQIVVFGKQAEVAGQYLKKGAQIYLEGKIQIREYTGKDGEIKKVFEIVCDNFRMLGGGERKEESKPSVKDDFAAAGYEAF